MEKIKQILSKLSNKQKIIIAIIFFILLILLFIYIYRYFYSNEDTNVYENSQINNTENELYAEETEDNNFSPKNIANNKEEKIIVHVIGEVNSPGVVTLTKGARIIDAINEAGGKTEDADLSKINLAYIVEDGTQIYIPRYNENVDDISLIREDAGNNIIIDTASNSENNENSKVNINTANLEKMTTLPGVGEALAQRIIDYRNANR